jgi:hypothetical protein
MSEHGLIHRRRWERSTQRNFDGGAHVTSPGLLRKAEDYQTASSTAP